MRPAQQKWQFACAPPTGSPTSSVLSIERPLLPCGGPFQAPGVPPSQFGHQGRTPLYAAAVNEHREVIQLLITAGPFGVELTSRPRVERGSRCRDLPLRDQESPGKGGLSERGHASPFPGDDRGHAFTLSGLLLEGDRCLRGGSRPRIFCSQSLAVLFRADGSGLS